MMQGDNDPVDVVEIGGTPLDTAGVYSVKALGAYAMIDGGELDWKVICICADHQLAPKLNDITDVERWDPSAALGKASVERIVPCSFNYLHRSQKGTRTAQAYQD